MTVFQVTMAVTRARETEAVPSVPGVPSLGIEVPFLVNNNSKWMSGIVEATTCGDIAGLMHRYVLHLRRR